MPDGVWLVIGVQAAGKSTVADLLARQFEHGVHVRGGQFYRWAVRGWVHAGDEPAAEESGGAAVLGPGGEIARRGSARCDWGYRLPGGRVHHRRPGPRARRDAT